MNPKRTALLAVVVTGFAAMILGAYTAPPELIWQLILGIEALLASGIVLLVLLRTPWLRALPPERQRRVIWFASGGTGLVVCLLPMAILFFAR